MIIGIYPLVRGMRHDFFALRDRKLDEGKLERYKLRSFQNRISPFLLNRQSQHNNPHLKCTFKPHS